MPSLVYEWTCRFERTFHDAIQSNPFLLKMNSTRGNTRDFQQIINQADHLAYLTFNDVAGLMLEFSFVLFLEFQELYGIDDRGEWVAEFVTEHCQELVLAAM